MSDPQQNKKMSIPEQPSSPPPEQPTMPAEQPSSPPVGPPPAYTPTSSGYPPQPGYAPGPGQQYQYQQPVMVQTVGVPFGVGGPGAFGLGNTPTPFTCPYCHHGVVTHVISQPGLGAWISCLVMFAFGLWCCMFIPFCMPDCQRSTHICPNCHRVIGYGGGGVIL